MVDKFRMKRKGLQHLVKRNTIPEAQILQNIAGMGGGHPGQPQPWAHWHSGLHLSGAVGLGGDGGELLLQRLVQAKRNLGVAAQRAGSFSKATLLFNGA